MTKAFCDIHVITSIKFPVLNICCHMTVLILHVVCFEGNHKAV